MVGTQAHLPIAARIAGCPLQVDAAIADAQLVDTERGRRRGRRAGRRRRRRVGAEIGEFHRPALFCSRRTTGWSSSAKAICTCRCSSSGHSFTPSCSDLAVTKGLSPNAGSSPMRISSASSEPDQIDTCSCPSVTSRPSAWLRLAWICGRKWFATSNSAPAPTTSTSSTSASKPSSRRFMAVTSCESWSDDTRARNRQRRARPVVESADAHASLQQTRRQGVPR
ncbi:hypothetical protein LSPH26S_03804 [Lysinibacillus sphaericus]